MTTVVKKAWDRLSIPLFIVSWTVLLIIIAHTVLTSQNTISLLKQGSQRSDCRTVLQVADGARNEKLLITIAQFIVASERHDTVTANSLVVKINAEVASESQASSVLAQINRDCPKGA